MTSADNIVSISVISLLLIIIIVVIIIIAIKFSQKLNQIKNKSEGYKSKPKMMKTTEKKMNEKKYVPTYITKKFISQNPQNEGYIQKDINNTTEKSISQLFDGINKNVLFENERGMAEIMERDMNRINDQRALADGMQMYAVKNLTPAEARKYAVEQNYIYDENNSEALPKELLTSMGIAEQVKQGAIVTENQPVIYTSPMSNVPNANYNANNKLTEIRNKQLNALGQIGQVVSDPMVPYARQFKNRNMKKALTIN